MDIGGHGIHSQSKATAKTNTTQLSLCFNLIIPHLFPGPDLPEKLGEGNTAIINDKMYLIGDGQYGFCTLPARQSTFLCGS